MPLYGQTIAEFDFSPDAPPSIVGSLTTGQTVNIALWENGSGVSISASGCTEIGSTGRYTWSTSGIPTLSTSRKQFHWRMDDGAGGTDDGDFMLVARENRDGGMPSLNSPSDYIIQN